MPYEIQLNLQQRAALKIAISFWEENEVKNKAAEFFKIWKNFSDYDIRRKWSEFTKTVIDEWNNDKLPQTLELDLIHLVKMIGQTIFNWYQYIEYEYSVRKNAINFIDEIKWTPFGTIDEVQIFKSSWLENPKLDITDVYNFACHYAMEDYIDDLWNKIPRIRQDNFYIEIYEHFDEHILAYWKCCRDNDLPNLMGYYQMPVNDFNEDDSISIFSGQQVFNLLYDLSRSTEENMLRLTVYQGHFNAMKYFWEKLTEQEREESVLKCARIAVLRWDYYVKNYYNTSDYKVNQCIEICIFLMNQMTNQDKKSFFNENLILECGIIYQEVCDVKSKILGVLLSRWPWEELFIPILEDMLLYTDDDSKMDCEFLEAITYKMYKDHELGYSLKTSKYRSLFREAWLIIPASIKRKMPQVNRWFSSIDNLISVWDLDNLNLIINDPVIVDVKDQFINIGSSSYEKLVANDEFEKLDQLMEKLFKSDEEKRSFKQNLYPWNKIFENREVNVADKFLDWQSNTQEERRSLKNNINHIKVCETFIKNGNFEALDKFLDWKFETLEERIKCEDHFKNDIFVIKKVYGIWKELELNRDEVKQKSSRFLEWVFKSNEEIKCFKTEKLVNMEIDQSVIDSLIIFREFHMIDGFLSWCLLDDTEIERIKRSTFMQNQRWF